MKRVVVIGGGAGGFFGAITIKEFSPSSEVIILEKSPSFLSKVKISGGGRCNVTNATFDVKDLINNYPRGNKELLGPFTRFNPQNTIEWFESRDVKLKTENDKRIFPVTDSSQTIVDCFLKEAGKNKIILNTKTAVDNINYNINHWNVKLSNNNEINCDAILIASGSSDKIWKILNKLGHKIIPPVPSLFTFHSNDKILKNLSGVSIQNAKLFIENSSLISEGPLLITHWGLSGPAVLILSSFGARILNEKNYNFTLIINWSGKKEDEIKNELMKQKNENSKKQIGSFSMFSIPARLWEKIIEYSGLDLSMRWLELSNKQISNFTEAIFSTKILVSGKSMFKEEFVTCGGVSLNEINFKTMESKILPSLYFAGEVLDIDAVTGGFNFQAAWTTSFIAGKSIAECV